MKWPWWALMNHIDLSLIRALSNDTHINQIPFNSAIMDYDELSRCQQSSTAQDHSNDDWKFKKWSSAFLCCDAPICANYVSSCRIQVFLNPAPKSTDLTVFILYIAWYRFVMTKQVSLSKFQTIELLIIKQEFGTKKLNGG